MGGAEEVERWLRVLEQAAEQEAENQLRLRRNHQLGINHAVAQIAAQSEIAAPEQLLAMLPPRQLPSS